MQNDAYAVARSTAAFLGNHRTVCIVCHGLQFARRKGNVPHRTAFVAITRVNRLNAQGFAIEEQLRRRSVGHDRHVDHLAGVPVPMDADMDHGLVRPQGFEEIPVILGENSRVHHAEIAGTGMVRRRLADVVDAAPQVLSQGVVAVQVFDDHLRHIPGAPGGGAVAQRGALQIVIGEDGRAHREAIDAAAGHGRGGFTAVDGPFRMLGVVLVVELLTVVVADRLHELGTMLCSRPGHVIAADGGGAIPLGIMAAHILAEHLRDLACLLRAIVGIADFIADGPHQE